jgi:hypothetical protein
MWGMWRCGRCGRCGECGDVEDVGNVKTYGSRELSHSHSLCISCFQLFRVQSLSLLRKVLKPGKTLNPLKGSFAKLLILSISPFRGAGVIKEIVDVSTFRSGLIV